MSRPWRRDNEMLSNLQCEAQCKKAATQSRNSTLKQSTRRAITSVHSNLSLDGEILCTINRPSQSVTHARNDSVQSEKQGEMKTFMHHDFYNDCNPTALLELAISSGEAFNSFKRKKKHNEHVRSMSHATQKINLENLTCNAG